MSPRKRPRGEVLTDNDVFEMDRDRGLHLRDLREARRGHPAPVGRRRWHVPGRTNGVEEGARYGWGIIKSHLDDFDQTWEGTCGSSATGTAEPPSLRSSSTCRGWPTTTFACTVDRTNQVTKVYGQRQPRQSAGARSDLDVRDAARLPARELLPLHPRGVDDQYSNCVPTRRSTLVRLQSVALTPEQVAETERTSPRARSRPIGRASRKQFRRGDSDAKGGVPNITDGIFVLNYLFLGGPTPTCLEAADADNKAA